VSVYRKNILAVIAAGSIPLREEVAAAAARYDLHLFFCDRCLGCWLLPVLVWDPAADGIPDPEIVLSGWEFVYLSENEIPVATLCRECAPTPDDELLASDVGWQILRRLPENLECARADS